MFTLQASASSDPVLTQSLQEAIGRVTAVARIHERLYRSPEILKIDLAAYLADICGDLSGLSPHHEIHYEGPELILISTDRAVRIALLVTELVTNAAKYAHPAGGHGCILVYARPAGLNTVALSVRDEGSGLPEGFGIRAIHGLTAVTQNSSIGCS